MPARYGIDAEADPNPDYQWSGKYLQPLQLSFHSQRHTSTSYCSRGMFSNARDCHYATLPRFLGSIGLQAALTGARCGPRQRPTTELRRRERWVQSGGETPDGFTLHLPYQTSHAEARAYG